MTSPRTTSEPARPDTFIESLPGVGARNRDRLAKLGLRTVSDLVTHFPSRWVDRGEVTPMGEVAPREAEVEAGPEELKVWTTVLGQVVGARVAGRPRRRWGRGGGGDRLEVVLKDDTGSVTLVFFGGAWRQPHFPQGATVLVSGTVGLYRGRLQFQNPDYEILNEAEEAAFYTGRLLPLYPLTKGLTQRQMRTWVAASLEVVAAEPELFPDSLRKAHDLMPRQQALQAYHYPASLAEAALARRRLAFEELFLDQLLVQAVRLRRELGKRSPQVPPEGTLYRRIRAALPFSLTQDQERALEDILQDLARSRPMNRLLQGDVGSGKTVVALLAAAAAADAGVQTVFMAPTELLAEQHHRTLRDFGAAFGLEPRILTGSTSAAARREVLRVFADGSAPLAVGTHALFQDEVRFRNLGLVVVDEQHRFGVVQRVALMEKGSAPHVLVMSATPIPRSLALVRYADLDLSIIRERPAGRGEVITRVTTEDKREAVYGFIAERIREGRQAFIIYPLVEESDKSELKAATTMSGTLARRPEFADFTVALLHGQMKSQEKDAVMGRFVAGEINVLVATTVVEVGIDVPNATFMLIEHPERYGLSQLHQLRGRIGRGEHKSYCVLMRAPEMDEGSSRRMELFAGIHDGFELARADLSLRGQGDVMGTRQSGRPAYKIADPWRDGELAEAARERAHSVLAAGKLTGDGNAGWEPLRKRMAAALLDMGSRIEAG